MDNDEITVLDLFVVLAKHKRLMVALPFMAALLGALISLALPNLYTATTRIMPPAQSQSSLAGALLGSLGSTLGGGIASSLNLQNPSDLYVGMLQSHSVQDALIRRFELGKLYAKDTLLETRKALLNTTSITVGKDGIIVLEVDDEDPRRAAALANAYVDELDRLTQTVSISDASRKRVYLEKQLRQAKDQLAVADLAMRGTMEKTGLIRLEDQGRAVIEAVAALRAQVAAREVHMSAMRLALTDGHPDLVRARQEFAVLRAELAKLERDNPSDARSVLQPAGKVPEVGLEWLRRLRDVKYHETLYEALAKQYEIARSDEAADSAQVQVLDRAGAPDDKSKPSRSLIAVLAGILGVIVASMIAFALEARQMPATADRLERLLGHLRS